MNTTTYTHGVNLCSHIVKTRLTYKLLWERLSVKGRVPDGDLLKYTLKVTLIENCSFSAFIRISTHVITSCEINEKIQKLNQEKHDQNRKITELKDPTRIEMFCFLCFFCFFWTILSFIRTPRRASNAGDLPPRVGVQTRPLTFICQETHLYYRKNNYHIYLWQRCLLNVRNNTIFY